MTTQRSFRQVWPSSKVFRDCCRTAACHSTHFSNCFWTSVGIHTLDHLINQITYLTKKANIKDSIITWMCLGKLRQHTQISKQDMNRDWWLCPLFTTYSHVHILRKIFTVLQTRICPVEIVLPSHLFFSLKFLPRRLPCSVIVPCWLRLLSRLHNLKLLDHICHELLVAEEAEPLLAIDNFKKRILAEIAFNARFAEDLITSVTAYDVTSVATPSTILLCPICGLHAMNKLDGSLVSYSP